MTVTTGYQEFLARAAAALGATGAQILLAPQSYPTPAWAREWDQILLHDSPGSHRLYAFTSAGGAGPAELRARLDRLVQGLGATGILEQGPVSLIAVVVATDGLPPARRQITSLSPSVYFANLRPAAWLVDLGTGSVHTGRHLGTPEGKDLLQQAASNSLVPPEDVHQLRERHIQQTNAFYQLMRGRQPLVTYALVAINVILFLLLYLNGGPTNSRTLLEFGALSPRLIEQGEWWRLGTSMFLHAGIPHIMFNMASLIAVGVLAERLYGSIRFLAIYLGAGLIGSLVSFGYAVATGSMDVVGVGASGAIFGVAGALLTLRFQHSEVIPQQLRDRVSSSMLPLVLISLVFAYLTPHVDNSAHIGGLLGGMALSFLFPLTREIPELEA